VIGKLSRAPPREAVRVRSIRRKQAAEIEGQTGLWARRFERLCKRLLSTTKPIVWLCAMPGSGKTRLLLELEKRTADKYAAGLNIGDWVLWDDPSPEDLRAALTVCRRSLAASGVLHAARGKLNAAGGSSESPGRRLVVGSRSSSEAARSLLTPHLYGLVEVIDEQDLFLRPADCRSTKDRELLAATGGWPMLLDGYSGRAAEMVHMLPAFLDREALPEVPSRVTTALFGSLPAPLGAAALKYLFGAEKALHPLLKSTSAGVTAAGEWVRDALLKLRGRPQVLRGPALDDLIQLHTRFDDPTRAICSLVDLGLFTQAIEVFNAAGGMFFGYRQGYQALETVLQKFGPDWETRTESLFFARLYLIVKSGQSREALMRLESQYPGLPVDLRRMRLSHRPYALLMRLDISLDNDETPPLDVISSWERLGGLFAPGDDIALGILYNTMAIGFLQAGALVQALKVAREALALYERAGSPYLMHYMLLHLCDLSLRHGRLSDAADEVRRAEEALRASGMAFNSEAAIFKCFKARIAYEEGRFADSPADIEPILQALLRGDSWADLISAMASHCVFTAFWQQGLRKAVDRLDHCALTLSRRHGTAQNRELDLIRIRLFQIARRHEEAGVRLEEYDLEVPAQRLLRLEAEEGLIRLRQQIVQQRPTDAAFKFAVGLAKLPSLEARHRIALGILHSYLHHRNAEQGLARRHLGVALRHAEAHNLLGVLVEEGEFLERLLPMYVARPSPGNARLTAFAQRVARLLRMQASAPMYSKALAGVTRQEHRVLSYVADGYTNKQIARALDCSESVIKFHLRNLFRKLKVSSRAALCEAAERRGIRT
jgi:DNA-binding CsgD family transcriptional regulator